MNNKQPSKLRIIVYGIIGAVVVYGCIVLGLLAMGAG